MNEPLTITAAFLAGLAGSGHCLGMCGPLAVMAGSGGGRRSLRGIGLHNGGRLLGYAALGAAVGWLGIATSGGLSAHTTGPVLRGLLGVVLALLGIQLLAPQLRYNPLNWVGRFIAPPIWRQLQPIAVNLALREDWHSQIGRGVLWGWLPCGLVYSLLMLAAVSGSAAAGAGVMLAFGLGTLPAMLGAGLAGRQLRGLSIHRLRPVMGAAMIAGGLIVATVPLTHLLGEHHHPGGGSASGHEGHQGHQDTGTGTHANY
ncbi:MAG: sulfite exporter TauE/SafE family protein [Lysobacterales bacterium]